MSDPIKVAEDSEREVATLTAQWLKTRPTATTSKRERKPTLFEQYRAASRGESFGDWLKAQGLPCA